MRTCKRCQKRYINVSNSQKYCLNCIPVVRRQYSNNWNKSWRRNNLEKAREKDKKERIKYKERRIKYRKEYYNKNKDTKEYKERIDRWWKKNLDKKKGYNKKYFQLHKEDLRIKRKLYRKLWRNKNKEKLNSLMRERLKTDIKLRLSRVISKAIWEAIKKEKAGRKWEDLVGYSLEMLIKHLERQFLPEMTWENFGEYWHIDHKRPKSWFNSSPEDFKKCWSLNNLQPLEKYKNLSKNNHYAS